MDKKSYAFGMSVASSFYQQGIHVNNVEDFLKGLKDMLTGVKPEISMEEAGEALEAFYKELEDEAGRRQRADELSRLRAKVAKDARLPESVVESLSGTDEETLAAQAKAIAEAMRPATAPRLSEQGRAPVGEGEDRQEERAFVRKLLGRE